MSVQLKTSSGLIPISVSPEQLTYTLAKNAAGEIVLTSSKGTVSKITDKDTTYTFSETNHVLTITGSDGTTKDIQLGGEITKEAVETALGFTPLQASDIANKADKATTLEGYGITDAVKNDDSRLTNARPASDVKDWAKADNKPSYTASEVGALADTTTHLSGDIATSEKGANNGVATLDETGKIPSSQLPSYVDDVLEYNNKEAFPTEGESGKIYIDKDKNVTYRWSGTQYVAIGSDLALGETSSTAYAGDKGKAVTDAFNTHKDDTDIHVTADERTAWNAKTSNIGTITSVKMNGTTVASSGEVDLGTVITEHQDISGKADKATTLEGYGITDAVSNTDSRLSDARPASDVKGWAKADNKPTYTASEVGALADTTTHLSGDIATSEKGANNGVATLDETGRLTSSQLPVNVYSKPTSGIPSTDLAESVQTSLGKADTALQSFTEEDPTVPSYVKEISETDISGWDEGAKVWVGTKAEYEAQEASIPDGTRIYFTDDNEAISGGGVVGNCVLKGNIIPDSNDTYTIGSEDNKLKAIYASEVYMSSNTLYINGTPVFHTDNTDDLMFTADTDQSIKVRTNGHASTNVLSEEAINVRTDAEASNININAGNITTGTSSNVNITASNNISTIANTQITNKAPNLNLEGAVSVTGGLTADNISISGNLTVSGTTTTIDTQNLNVKDNIIVINKGEAGSGVTSGQAGIRVDRGDYEDYAILFDETDDMFKIGQLGNLQVIATQDYVNSHSSEEVITDDELSAAILADKF